MLSAFTATRERPPGSERVDELSRWLANQRAMPRSQTEQTAWRLMEEATRGMLVLEGPKAPIVVQERFSLWLVGQLGGRPLMHIFVSSELAIDKAKEVAKELRVPVLVIDRGGEIAERHDCEPVEATPAKPAAPPAKPLTSMVTKAPEMVAKAPEMVAKAPDSAQPPTPIAAKPAPQPIAEHPLPSFKVDRHEHRWAVFVDGRPVATASTREKARVLARTLKADPDFTDGTRQSASKSND